MNSFSKDPSHPKQRCCSEAEAATYLSRSPRTLADWRLRGVGPAWVRMGSSVAYSIDDLDEYVNKHTVMPANAEQMALHNCTMNSTRMKKLR